MLPSDTPLIDSLIAKIWNRYTNGQPREQFEGNLDAAIAASLTKSFDYRKYLPELPSCRHLAKAADRLLEMTPAHLSCIPREEAVGLINIELYASLERRAEVDEARRNAAAIVHQAAST